jgi:hypothetical protein
MTIPQILLHISPPSLSTPSLSISYRKLSKSPLVCLPLYFHVRDQRTLWSLMAPGDEPLNPFFFTLGYDLNVAVRAVAHPTGHS